MHLNYRKSLLASAIASAVILSSSPAPVLAEGLVIEEVRVTARKKEESLVDVPMSITAVSGEDVSKLNITDLENLQDALPNLSIVSSALSSQRTYIRGQGSDTNQGFEQSVGWFVDGIYGGRGEQFKTPTFDVSSIELLRGPQGTVLGKNIIAGAINIRTARPTADTEGRISALYGDGIGEKKLEAVVSGSLTDYVRGRIALLDRSTDGWIKNTASAAPDFGEDLGAQDDEVGRLSLEFDISESISAFFKAETSSAKVDGISNQVFINADDTDDAATIAAEDDLKLSDESTVLTPCGDAALRTTVLVAACDRRGNNATFADVNSDNYVLELNFDVDGYEITVLNGLSQFDSERLIDSDYSNLTLLDNWQVQSFEQFSQEFRISSPGDQLVDWTAGMYYQDNEYESQTSNLFAGLLDSLRLFNQDSDALSFFGEGTLNITDSFRFILGARWTEEEKSFDKEFSLLDPTTGDTLTAGTATPTQAFLANSRLRGDWFMSGPGFENVVDGVIFTEGDRKETESTFAGTFQYDHGESQFYLNVAEGFKAGGFDEGNRTAVPLEFEPEEALAYELGGKFILADGAANLNVAIFHVNYENLQVSVFDGIAFQVANAAESTSQGVEVDGRWRLTEEITVGGAAAYLDSEYDSYEGAACTVIQEAAFVAGGGTDGECAQDLSGESTNFAPEFSGNVNVTYETTVGRNMLFSARVDLSYRDEMFTQGDNDPLDRVNSYSKWDARLALGSVDEEWEVAVIGKNLGDKRYALFSGDTPIVDGSHASPVAQPRTVALQATLRAF